MAITLTNVESFSASFSQNGISHLVPNSTSSMTMVFIASTSNNNAPCSNVNLPGVTLTLLNSFSTLFSGTYRRIDIYYALGTTGSGSPVLFTCNTVPGQTNVEISIVSFVGVIQQAFSYIGGLKGTLTQNTSYIWKGLTVVYGNYSIVLWIANADPTDFSGTINQYGYSPALASNLPCKGAFSISDGTTSVILLCQF
jgi:hypothetical protein